MDTKSFNTGGVVRKRETTDANGKVAIPAAPGAPLYVPVKNESSIGHKKDKSVTPAAPPLGLGPIDKLPEMPGSRKRI
jgi:hypothetical protein